MCKRTKYIFVYQSICEKNGKSYVGVHACRSLTDGYIGCGIFKQNDAKLNCLYHRAVRKYGYNAFKVYILSFYNTYEDALEEERFIVNKNWVKSKHNYNTALGGRGGSIYGLSESAKKNLYKKRSITRANWRASEATKKRMSDSHKGKVPYVPTQKSRQNQSIAAKKRTPNNTKPICQYLLSGEFVKEHISSAQAARGIGCLKTSLNNNLRGLTKACAGFYFTYKS